MSTLGKNRFDKKYMSADAFDTFTRDILDEINPEIRWITRNEVGITQTGVDRLMEYSTSLPTGTTDGKVWKCWVQNVNSTPPSGYWLMGEYVDMGDPETMAIFWRRVVESP